MQTYEAEVILGGLPMKTSVVKEGLTAPEIMLLRALHGQDAVINIQPRSMDKRSHVAERARLEEIYGASEDDDVEEHVGSKALFRLFGAKELGAKLPVSLPDVPALVGDAVDA